MKKITKATFKSFIRRNRENLLISVASNFDMMTDCVTSCGNGLFETAEATTRDSNYTMGVEGVYLVGGSRNWFEKYEDDNFTGIHACNCCGSFTIAIRKAVN